MDVVAKEKHEDGPKCPSRKRIAEDKRPTLKKCQSKKGQSTLKTCGISFSQSKPLNRPNRSEPLFLKDQKTFISLKRKEVYGRNTRVRPKSNLLS